MILSMDYCYNYIGKAITDLIKQTFPIIDSKEKLWFNVNVTRDLFERLWDHYEVELLHITCSRFDSLTNKPRDVKLVVNIDGNQVDFDFTLYYDEDE